MGMLDMVGTAGLDTLEQVLAMAQDRHKLLADNIANIDTPGYGMRDIDKTAFDRALASAVVRGRRRNPNLNRVRFDNVWDPAGSTREASRLRGILFHDDNNRSVEELMVEMNKNSIRQAQAAALMRNQLSLLRTIVSENV